MQPRNVLFLFLTVCLALSSVTASADGKGDLIKLVPASANGFIIAKDTPKLLKQWSSSPFSKLWNDPQVKLFFAPLRDEMEIDTWSEKVKEETGYELDQLQAMLTGDVIIYMSEMEELAADPDHNPEIVLLAEVGEHQDELEELLLRQAEEREEEDESISWITEETRGVEMHIERSASDEQEGVSVAWAVNDGVLMLTSPAEQLVNVISSQLDGETDSPIEASSSFQMVRRNLPEHDVLLYLDLTRMIQAMFDSFEEEAGEEAQVHPKVVFDALKLGNLLGLFFTANLEDSFMAGDLGVVFTENKGLAKVLAYGPDAATNPSFIPAEASSFASTNFDIQSAWTELEVVLNQINPALLAMAAVQVNTFKESAGVELDLRKDLLENLSGEIVMVQVPQDAKAPGEEVQVSQPEQVIAFGIEQRQGLELTIETLKGALGQGSELFTERQFLGTSVYTLRGTEDQSQPMSISYAITDDYFLLSVGSSSTAMEAVIIAMQRPVATPVWELEDVKKSLAALPAGAVGVGYQDLAETGNMVFEMLSLMSTLDDELTLCNPEEMPEPEVMAKYLGPMSSGVYKDSNSLIMRVRVLPAKGATE